jgi:acetyl esterase/lipase
MRVRRTGFVRAAAVVLSLVLALAVAGCGGGGGDDGPDDAHIQGTRPFKYGDAPSQVAELTIPEDSGAGPFPVVVLIHGGWWREGDFDRTLMRDLANDLVFQGYATWNLEYRLVGEEGGGWPGTFEDVAAGIDLLAQEAEDNDLDLSRVLFLGHSAGGQLALCAGSRHLLPAGEVGSAPVVTPTSVVALAPITDFELAVEKGTGDGAVEDLLGGTPDEIPEVYAVTSPIELAPMGHRVLIAHGTEDDRVPLAQGESYYDKAKAGGDPAEFVILEGGDHFDPIDPGGEGWAEVVERLPSLFAPVAKE